MITTLSVAIPCRADEPGLETTLESLSIACQDFRLPPSLLPDLVICINSLQPGDVCVPLTVARDFCVRYGVPSEEIWLASSEQTTTDRGQSTYPSSFTEASQERSNPQSSRTSQTLLSGPFSRCTVLLTARRGKPPAWNILWRWVRGETVLFSDADVRVDQAAVFFLYHRLQQDAALRLVAAREVPVLQDGGTLWSRMGAIPYRFNFGNAGGRLLLIRKAALPSGIPEDLLLEDAWLTVAVGRDHVAKESRAQVFFLPPATGRDYFAERVRTEGGKLQIHRVHRELLATGPIARYQWSQFRQEIALKEYPLVMLALVLRVSARLWAWFTLTRKDFYSLYRLFSSTKKWESRRG